MNFADLHADPKSLPSLLKYKSGYSRFSCCGNRTSWGNGETSGILSSNPGILIHFGELDEKKLFNTKSAKYIKLIFKNNIVWLKLREPYLVKEDAGIEVVTFDQEYSAFFEFIYSSHYSPLSIPELEKVLVGNLKWSSKEDLKRIVCGHLDRSCLKEKIPFKTPVFVFAISSYSQEEGSPQGAISYPNGLNKTSPDVARYLVCGMEESLGWKPIWSSPWCVNSNYPDNKPQIKLNIYYLSQEYLDELQPIVQKASYQKEALALINKVKPYF